MGKTALLATKNPERIVPACRRLTALGWHLVGTKNVADVLKAQGLAVEDVAAFVGVADDLGVPPTLHPRIEAALTQEAEDAIDLVFDVPYPVSEGHDVGGRALLALGAKGNRWVVCDEKDLDRLVVVLEKGDADLQGLRRKLIGKALWEIGRYYMSFAAEHSQEYEGFIGRRKFACAEGENPYQESCDAFVLDEQDPLGLDRFVQVSGMAPSFTTIADMDNILAVVQKLKGAFLRHFKKQPFMTVAAKHGNPCGLGIDWNDPQESIRKALWGNPQAIWGGEVICNFPIDRPSAQVLLESARRKERLGAAFWMLDLIVAAWFSKEAVDLLGRREHRVLMGNRALAEVSTYERSWHYRFLRGGYLRQAPADFVLNMDEVEWPDFPVADAASLFIAWATAYASFLGGNEVALAKEAMLIGSGGGPSTVMAAQNAVSSALLSGHDPKGALFCANAFFPFPDAAEILVANGCVGGIVPAGGKQHDVNRRYFKDRGISCGFIPASCRGFSRH